MSLKSFSSTPDKGRDIKLIKGSMPSISRLRLPHNQSTQPFIRPDRIDEMYPMMWPPFDNNDVQKRIGSVLGPLSLFAPYPHEDEPEAEELELQRPVTPIDEEIQKQPTSYEQLAKYVRRRIAAKPDVPFLSSDDQQNLAGIIMGEVNGIWSDVRKQIDDPFLSAQENKELNRRIAVHIVTVCEQLFNHYLDKAQILNSRGVFSGPANMSRLKAQLALEASKFLDILTIRRYLVADMRGKGDTDSLKSESLSFVTPSPRKPAHALSYQTLIQSSRPKSELKRHRSRTVEHEIKEMTSQMPTLDTGKLLGLVAELPDRNLKTPSDEGISLHSRASDFGSRSSRVSNELASRKKIILKRSKSEPDIRGGESLLEELSINPKIRHDPLLSQELKALHRERKDIKKGVTEDTCKFQPGTREYAAEDLRQLIYGTVERPKKKVEEDLAPLLQALPRHAKHDGLKERMDQKMEELEERDQQWKEAETVSIQEPLHPQPATVKAKMPNQMVVKTSDIRVSDRVCMSSITLNRFSTVYNDLTGEIDANTVKLLDKNLFLGEEIKEVYKEIMKTVPQDHLQLDSQVMETFELDENDPLVVTAPKEVSYSGTMASSTLTKRKNLRVLNPQLQKDNEAPWGDMEQRVWVRTPLDPPKNFAGEAVFAPLTPDLDRINNVLHHPSKQSMPQFMAEKLSRTYASWLQWWKGTVTSDDYMKYLSTQESDYLGAVFHFYDSGSDDDDEGTNFQRTQSGTTQSSKMNTEKREKEKKLQELRQVKHEYKEGVWNVNTIRMGGLGKEPEIEDHEAVPEVHVEVSRSADAPRSAKTLSERAALNQQMRLQADKSRSGEVSRASKASVTTLAGTAKEMPVEQKPPGSQERMEKLWSTLHMPDNLKLDMAIKYSCNAYFHRINKALKKWEQIAELILQREAMLSRLEAFERTASDPNRFFQKGSKGKSTARLEEARKRAYFSNEIADLDEDIETLLIYLRDKFKDSVTFRGRPYEDKMKWDRIEMMYWLQEERKQNAIKYEMLNQPLSLKQAHLDPIPVTK